MKFMLLSLILGISSNRLSHCLLDTTYGSIMLHSLQNRCKSQKLSNYVCVDKLFVFEHGIGRGSFGSGPHFYANVYCIRNPCTPKYRNPKPLKKHALKSHGYWLAYRTLWDIMLYILVGKYSKLCNNLSG